ncbi:hypothetical protein I7I53_00178 [Histoplasma capsulatum var. duboisii H88]|uniref:Uncharacterized protein n=1 Tax=Ajellomyces capsulatus (strain H88) TaxID=544711 RepID=A0A8A1LJB1_AJEC8|nr:hypothetical protein I7I53_00178 [Histoplasma capsulatum var. duboisii H88]
MQAAGQRGRAPPSCGEPGACTLAEARQGPTINPIGVRRMEDEGDEFEASRTVFRVSRSSSHHPPK